MITNEKRKREREREFVSVFVLVYPWIDNLIYKLNDNDIIERSKYQKLFLFI